MDGLQGPVAASLRFRLSLWLSVAVITVAAGAGVLSFRWALADAHALQDNQLVQTGFLISRLDAVPSAPLAKERAGDVDFEARVVVRFLRTPNGPPVAPAPRPPEFSEAMADGLQTVLVGQERWRVFVRTSATGLRVAVGQQTRVRDAMARASAMRTVMPILLLAPLLMVLVTVLVRRMFAPLQKLSDELARRQQHNMSQLSGGDRLPSEIWPFVAQINALLIRTGRTLAMQRRFIADAAHEMRSPLTAMSLQAERLAAADMPGEARVRLGALSAGLQRTRELLEQLLTLARSHEPLPAHAGPVALRQVVREVLEDLMPLAEAKHIDLGVVGEADALVDASRFDIKVLVKNLVDNAIRYTPDGGKVDITVGCVEGVASLQIDDTGPGIAEQERLRVFDPFYRVLGNGEIGSGLGLAIARTVADRVGASIELNQACPQHGGLRALVIFDPERAVVPSTARAAGHETG